MKKFLFALQVILLVAAGCNSSSTTQPIAQTTPTPQQQVAQNSIPSPAPALTSQYPLEIKGWLEGTVGNWTLAEVSANLSGRTGNKFHLQILDSAQCVAIIDSKTSNSFSCTDKNAPSKWGYGDSVKVYGENNDDGSFGVKKMEIVSALPLEQW